MRYMGGKSRTAKQLVATIIAARPDTTTWVEPFLGGASVAVAAATTGRFDRMILNELQPAIAAMWRAGIRGWEPPADAPTFDEYKNERSLDLSTPCAGFMSLAASFNGRRWKGYGPNHAASGRDYYAESRRAFLRDCAALARVPDVTVTHGDYSDVTIPPEAVVYADPPYAGTTGYGTELCPDRFWGWAADVGAWVSSYKAPDGWIAVSSVSRSATVNPTLTRTGIESLYRQSVSYRAVRATS